MDISVYLKRTFAIPQGGIVSENCYRPAREGLFKSIDGDQAGLTHITGTDFGSGELCSVLCMFKPVHHMDKRSYFEQFGSPAKIGQTGNNRICIDTDRDEGSVGKRGLFG